MRESALRPGFACLLIAAVIARNPCAAQAAGVDIPQGIADALERASDRTPLTSDDETAYYGLLQVVRDVDPGQLRAAAARFREDREQAWRANHQSRYVPFREFLESPEAFRGQPVSVFGHVIRVIESGADENPQGLQTLYEFWLVTDESQQNPLVIVTTEKPSGLPLGETLVDRVSATGLFYKLWRYPARDKHERLCPLILARTVEWSPTASSSNVFRWIIGAMAAAAGLILAAVALRSRQRSRRVRRVTSTAVSDPPDFSAWEQSPSSGADNVSGPEASTGRQGPT